MSRVLRYSVSARRNRTRSAIVIVDPGTVDPDPGTVDPGPVKTGAGPDELDAPLEEDAAELDGGGGPAELDDSSPVDGSVIGNCPSHHS